MKINTSDTEAKARLDDLMKGQGYKEITTAKQKKNGTIMYEKGQGWTCHYIGVFSSGYVRTKGCSDRFSVRTTFDNGTLDDVIKDLTTLFDNNDAHLKRYDVREQILSLVLDGKYKEAKALKCKHKIGLIDVPRGLGAICLDERLVQNRQKIINELG